MAITKDEVSDLKSLQDAVVARALEQQNAALALKQAEHNLAQFLRRLQATPQQVLKTLHGSNGGNHESYAGNRVWELDGAAQPADR